MMNSKASGAIGGAAQGAAIGAQIGGGVGAAIGGVLGGLGGLLGGGDEGDAKKLAAYEAELIERTGQENVRRMTRELKQGVGSIRAGIGASNITFTGSAMRYMNEYQAEGLRQIAWEKTKTRIESDAAKLGGQIAVGEIQSMGMSRMFNGLSSAASAGLFGSYTKSGGYTPPWSK